MEPTCPCGSTEFGGEAPNCRQLACMIRWVFRWLLPALLVLAAIIGVGLEIGPCSPDRAVTWYRCSP